MMKTKLAKAVALAIAGTALGAGGISSAAASTTMYNTYNAFTTPTPTDGNASGTQDGGTDGWVWGGIGIGPQGATNSFPGFRGIGGSSAVSTSTPFGYNGGGIVNWAIQLTSGSDSGVISQADSAKYGTTQDPFYADIDTAKGAWSDASLAGASGWRHNADFGLFQSTVATDVHLHIEGLTQSGTNFGFTIFSGVDTSAGGYAHHGDWNYLNNTQPGAPTATVPNPAPPPATKQGSLPGGGTNFTVGQIVAYSIGGATPSNLNDITFHAEANQIYTIVLGGYKNGGWGDTADGYVLSVTAVPIPAAVWLFGSALAGLGVFGRRKGS